MRKLIVSSFIAFSALAVAQEKLTLAERITNCETERKVLRQQILTSPVFAPLTEGKTGDEIEALIYTFGNYLGNGIQTASTTEQVLLARGRGLASDEEGDTALRAFVINRNLLNSLYAQRSRSRN